MLRRQARRVVLTSQRYLQVTQKVERQLVALAVVLLVTAVLALAVALVVLLLRWRLWRLLAVVLLVVGVVLVAAAAVVVVVGAVAGLLVVAAVVVFVLLWRRWWLLAVLPLSFARGPPLLWRQSPSYPRHLWPGAHRHQRRLPWHLLLFPWCHHLSMLQGHPLSLMLSHLLP